MEEKNEISYFKHGVFSKNLFLAEPSDYPYLIQSIKKGVKGEVFFFSEGALFSDLINDIFQPPLFGEKRVFIILSCDEYTDEEWDLLFQEKGEICFFFTSKAKKALIERFSKEGGVLSLIEEKPWDRKNRLLKEVIATFHSDGVFISQPTASLFVERVYGDLYLFTNELFKLRSFAQGKKSIEEKDIDELIPPLPEENTFKVTEDLVWKGEFAKHLLVDSSSLLLQMIGAIRFQAMLGLKLLSVSGGGVAPWQEKKYKQKAQSLGDTFFKKVFTLTFKAENRVKQTTSPPSAIFDFLSIQIIANAKNSR
jgi:DNA polymerase III delta subunit